MKLVNTCALKLLSAYLQIRFYLSFHKILFDISGVQKLFDINSPTLLISNHSSWWDGFFALELYNKIGSKKEFRIVMLESELKKFPFFRLCGAVGLIPKNPEHNLKVFKDLKNHFVCFFPQGALAPQNQRPISFKYGITNLIQILHPVQILTTAIHIEPFQFMKPTALIRVSSLIASDSELATIDALAGTVEKNLDDVSRLWTSQLYKMSPQQWK